MGAVSWNDFLKKGLTQWYKKWVNVWQFYGEMKVWGPVRAAIYLIHLPCNGLTATVGPPGRRRSTGVVLNCTIRISLMCADNWPSVKISFHAPGWMDCRRPRLYFLWGQEAMQGQCIIQRLLPPGSIPQLKCVMPMKYEQLSERD